MFLSAQPRRALHIPHIRHLWYSCPSSCIPPPVKRSKKTLSTVPRSRKGRPRHGIEGMQHPVADRRFDLSKLLSGAWQLLHEPKAHMCLQDCSNPRWLLCPLQLPRTLEGFQSQTLVAPKARPHSSFVWLSGQARSVHPIAKPKFI